MNFRYHNHICRKILSQKIGYEIWALCIPRSVYVAQNNWFFKNTFLGPEGLLKNVYFLIEQCKIFINESDLSYKEKINNSD